MIRMANPGSFDVLLLVRHDDQGALPLLPVLRGLLDERGHGGGARYSREYRFARPDASVAPRRSPPAGVRPTAADARLRRLIRGRVLLPRPGRRLLPERQLAHGAAVLVGSDPGRPSRLPPARGLDRERRSVLGAPRGLELRDWLPSMVLHPVADPDARRAPRRDRDGHVLVLPVPLLASGGEWFDRRLARGRGDRGPAVRVHRIGPVPDGPAVGTFGPRRLSLAPAL